MFAATSSTALSLFLIPQACPVVSHVRSYFKYGPECLLDTTGFSRGESMFAATSTTALSLFLVPRACPVVSHARSYFKYGPESLLDTTGLSRGESCSQLLQVRP